MDTRVPRGVFRLCLSSSDFFLPFPFLLFSLNLIFPQRGSNVRGYDNRKIRITFESTLFPRLFRVELDRMRMEDRCFRVDEGEDLNDDR